MCVHVDGPGLLSCAWGRFLCEVGVHSSGSTASMVVSGQGPSWFHCCVLPEFSLH